MKKIFILDTNVFLHDYECIFKFEDNDIIIPIMTLEELDNFKSGTNQINFNSREFSRILDELIGEQDISKGIKIGPKMGNLYVRNIKNFSDTVKDSFHEYNVDHKILSLVDLVKQENPKKQVILVSKDINIRLKAKSLGLQAQDYLNDMVDNIEELMKNSIITVETSDDIIDVLYSTGEVDPFKYKEFKKMEIKPNQNFILKSASKSVLCVFSPLTKKLRKIEKLNAFGITPKNSEQTFALNALLDPNIKVVALTGTPGCGKTLLSLAAAIQQQQNFDKIYISKSIVPLQSQDLGFLKGSLSEKMEPQIQAFYDNLNVIKHNMKKEKGGGKKKHDKEDVSFDSIVGEEKIEVSALAYIRGRSLPNIYFIVDESQNLTKHEIKTIVTRIGEDSKIVLLGDLNQIDAYYLDVRSNGLSQLCEKLSGQDFFAHVNLVKSERSLVAEVTSKLL